jgi:hypothetical protein
MRDDEKLVTVAEYENSFDAELGKLALDNAEIQSVLVGQNLVGNLTYGEASIMVELQVCEADAERARQVLAEKEPLEGESDE